MDIDLAQPGNQFLGLMQEDDLADLADDMEIVEMQLRDVVCEPGDELHYIYFPTTSMLSSIVVIDAERAVEAATIGREGMGGVAILVNEKKSPYRVIQQVKGEALRVSADRFSEALQASESLRTLVERYVFTLLEQCGWNAACNLHHSMDARLSRWLLQTSDRVGQSNFYITQEFLSEMVGASRQTVSATASTLQQEGLIDYSRGNVRIVDREGLERSSCECYVAYNDIYRKYMGVAIEKASVE